MDLTAPKDLERFKALWSETAVQHLITGYDRRGTRSQLWGTIIEAEDAGDTAIDWLDHLVANHLDKKALRKLVEDRAAVVVAAWTAKQWMDWADENYDVIADQAEEAREMARTSVGLREYL